ncbi:hypothetical protein [Cellulomonas sp. IC4_254]|uniref:hypothetical protein n=1 Tax=Cellulomonas sp. IC4_254 TaxID=2714040 RepID=UPI00141F6F19|nr:hypothetical protein [Cellulomonas sp. IC4_254]NHT18051.1 hypothetical protein [Cellulomonas sp. IC4_254]
MTTGCGLAALLLLLLGGCTDNGATADEPVPGPSYSAGPITEAEYLSIVRAVHSCMADEGYDVEDVERRTDGVTYGFQFSGSGTGSGSSSGQQDLVACEERYGLMAAEIAFQDQVSLSGAEREAVYGQLIACLDGAGVTGITSSSTAADVGQAIQQLERAGTDVTDATTCWNQYSTRLFGSSG